MIRVETVAPASARVIGELTEKSISVLMDAVVAGVRTFDLARVDAVDAAAVRVLAGLPAWCELVSCPRWLDLWLQRERARV